MKISDVALQLGKTQEQIQNYLDRGVLISSEDGVDDQSLQRFIQRREDMEKARAAFTSDDPLDRAAYLSGLSKEEINRLGGL